MNEIQAFINDSKLDLGDKNQRNIFEWQLAIQYGIKYQKYIRKELPISDEQIKDYRKVTDKYVPKDILDYIELFCQLDKEFKEFYGDINADVFVRSWKKIKHDIKWRGFWMRASGNDFSVFINWIKAGIKFEKYKKNTFEYWYLEEHKDVKGLKYVPFSVKAAYEMFKKYYDI